MFRAPALGLLDVRAKIAANNVVKRRLNQLLERYGADVVKQLFRQLLDYADQRVRARLRTIPDGTWTSENAVEGIREDHLRVTVTLTKSADSLNFDFSGSSPQVESSLNIGPVGTRSSALNPFVAMLCHDLPWNEGLFRACSFDLPEGSVVNPRRPAALSANVPAGANLLVLTTCHNVLSKMLLGAADDELRRESCGNCGGGHNTFVLAGARSDGQFFASLILDGNAGGGGAFPDRDGPDTGANHWAVKAVITNVESVELLYPFLYLWRQEVVDSGGPGRFRGGLGLTEAVIPWNTPQLTAITLGAGYSVRSSLGFSGGYPAPHSPAGVVRGADVKGRHFAAGTVPRSVVDLGGADERTAPKSVTEVMAADVLYGYVGSGGGGFGDPLERDPVRVRDDVELGSVSPQAAREVYGVVLAGTPPRVDDEATEDLRTALRRQRVERVRS